MGMQRLRRLLPRSGNFVTHAATYAVGNVISRLVGFLMLPIYTRFLTPADYGTVGLLTFALALMEPLFGARLARAVPKFYFDAQDERSQRAVIWSALLLTAGVSAVTTVAVAAFSRPVSLLLFGSQQYRVATALFAVNLLTQPLEYTGMMYIRLQERSVLYLGVSLAKLALQIAANIYLVVDLRLGVVGVVVSGVVSSMAVGMVLSIYIALHKRPLFDWAMSREMLRFCWPLWFSGLAGLYLGSSGAMYLRIFASLNGVGLLQLGLKFATVVTLLIWTPFFQHWEPMSYKYHREADAKERYQVAFVAVSVLMFVGGLGVSLFSEPAIKLMAAPAFYAAAETVPLLTLGQIFSNLALYFHFGFLIAGRTRISSLCQYIAAGILTIGYVSLVPRFGLRGAVEAQCLAYAANFTYVYIWSKRYFDPGFDVVPIPIFILIGVIAYEVAIHIPLRLNVGALIYERSVIFLLATVCMVVVALRGIRASSPEMYGAVSQSVRRLAARTLGA